MAVVTLAEFRAYVGTDEESTFVTECLDAGKSLVARYVDEVTGIPEHIKNQCVLIASSELFHRRSAPNGVAQFASMDGSPVRVAKDPMNAVYPLLLPYVGYGV
jgi:hypothetical protein